MRMTRRLGYVEQSVFAVLAERDCATVREIAEIAYQQGQVKRAASPAETSAVRRALAKMKKRGEVVKLRSVFRGTERFYCSREGAIDLARRIKALSRGASLAAREPELAALLNEAGPSRPTSSPHPNAPSSSPS